MRWMKFVVIILGLLIVCAAGLLGYGFYKKTSDPEWKLSGSTLQPGSPTMGVIHSETDDDPLPEFGDIRLKMAPGCFIRTAHPKGKRLYVTLGPRDTCGKVFVIDMTNGRTLGTVSPDR